MSSFAKGEADAGKSFFQAFPEALRIKWYFKCPIARLPHPGFQVGEVQWDAAADIPDEIVKIPAFDAAFPIPAEHRVELAGEQAGKIVKADLMGRGHESGEHFGGRARWRVGVDFQLDADDLAFGKTRRDFRRCSDLEKVDDRAAFQKRRLDGRGLGFLDSFRPELETQAANSSATAPRYALSEKSGLGVSSEKSRSSENRCKP